MGRIKQSKLNSRRSRTRLRATPEGRHLHRELVAKGRGPLLYQPPQPVLRERLREAAKEAQAKLSEALSKRKTKSKSE